MCMQMQIPDEDRKDINKLSKTLQEMNRLSKQITPDKSLIERLFLLEEIQELNEELCK
jgi:hypothetical protein